MSATLVPTVNTKYTPAQLVKGFIEAWIAMFSSTPKKESIGVIYAQMALETGLSKSMFNNNIGNVKYVAKTSDSDAIEYCMLKNVWEIEKGKKVIYQPPAPQTWFRSFKTLKNGVIFHFNFIRNNRYKDSWAAIEKGDTALFAHILREKGYYTAPESDYAKSMNYHFNLFMSNRYYEDALVEIAQNNQSKDPSQENSTPVQNELPTTPDALIPSQDATNPTPPVENSDESTPAQDRKQVEVSVWHKLEILFYNFLSAMPWIKLIELLTSKSK